jgi:hypothetical protein
VVSVFRPGSTVLLTGQVLATVVAVSLTQGDCVQYRVVWWDGPDRKDIWVEAFEVRPDDGTVYSSIGFCPTGG